MHAADLPGFFGPASIYSTQHIAAHLAWSSEQHGLTRKLLELCSFCFLQPTAPDVPPVLSRSPQFSREMRRISIDTLGMISPRGASFAVAKRRHNPWYLSRPRLLTTCLLFAGLYLWLNFGGTTVLIPEDSYALLEDESLKDILNSTLGVC